MNIMKTTITIMKIMKTMILIATTSMMMIFVYIQHALYPYSYPSIPIEDSFCVRPSHKPCFRHHPRHMGLPVVVLTNLHKAHGFRISVTFPMTHQVGNCRRKRCTTSSDPSSSQLVATWTRLVVSAEISRAQSLLHEIYWPQQRFAVLRAKILKDCCVSMPLFW